jgi:hypothetical protein
MEEKFNFGIEVLEPRFEFKPLGQWLLDAICWLGESIADIGQALIESASPTLGYNFGTGHITVGVGAPGFFRILFENWGETWEEYWGEPAAQ